MYHYCDLSSFFLIQTLLSAKKSFFGILPACSPQKAHFWLKMITRPGFCHSLLNISLIVVKKLQLNSANLYCKIFQPVLQMHLLQEEQPRQNVNFHSPTTTELIMSALITKLPTKKPGAEQ